jgi:hypothetical protein
VIAASGIEVRVAAGTHVVTRKVLPDGQFPSAYPAQDCVLIPFLLRPNFEGMAGYRVMAFLARVERPTTFHFDSDHIYGFAVMHAAGLRVESNSVDLGSRHGYLEFTMRRNFTSWSKALSCPRTTASLTVAYSSKETA